MKEKLLEIFNILKDWETAPSSLENDELTMQKMLERLDLKAYFVFAASETGLRFAQAPDFNAAQSCHRTFAEEGALESFIFESTAGSMEVKVVESFEDLCNPVSYLVH